MPISVQRPPQAVADINVTPMIDVMLVLLIIFMVVTPTMVLPVKTPEARKAVPAREDRVTLAVDREGRFYLDLGDRPAPVAHADLGARLRDAYAARPGDGVLYLQADENADYARVLDALHAAGGAGVRRVTAITSPPAGGAGN